MGALGPLPWPWHASALNCRLVPGVEHHHQALSFVLFIPGAPRFLA